MTTSATLRTRHALLATLIANAFVPAVFAADATVKTSPVVVTATRVEQNSFDLPVSIDVVSGAQMQDSQFMVNASEALVRVPGIAAPNSYRFSSDQQVSSRGFGARAAFGVRGIRLYADGVPQTMPDGQGQMGTFSLSSAERMEVLRGPFSALYGNSSGGVIQIFTRDGKGAPRATASAYIGSFSTSRADVLAEGDVNGVGYLVDASRYETNGYREHSAARRDHLNAKLTWQLGEKTRATVVLNSLDQPYNDDPGGLTRAQMESDPRQISNALTRTQNAGGSKSQTQIGVNLAHQLTSADTLQLVGWSGGRKTLGRLALASSATAVIAGSGGISIIDRDFYGTDLRWMHKTETATGPLTLTLGLNYEYMKDIRTGFNNSSGAIGVLRRNEDNIVSNSGQYAQAEWNLGKDWILSGGIRTTKVSFKNKDRYIAGGATNPDDSGSVAYDNTSPVLGVVYHLTPAINLYANAGKGFETPTFIELAYQTGGASGLNFGLKPSTSVNVEAGVKAFVGNHTRVNVALFEVRTDKEIVVSSSVAGRTTYTNAGKTGREGLELAVESDLGNNFQANLALATLDARFKDSFTSSGGLVKSDNKLPGTPRSTVYGEVSWRHPASGFKTSIEAIHSSKVYVDDQNTDAAAAYAVVNWKGSLEQRLGGISLKEFIRIENLGDKRYVGGVLVNNASPFAPAPGRNFLAGISASMDF